MGDYLYNFLSNEGFSKIKYNHSNLKLIPFFSKIKDGVLRPRNENQSKPVIMYYKTLESKTRLFLNRDKVGTLPSD